MKPRRAALVGIVFVPLAFGYWLLPYLLQPWLVDIAGITMLLALGTAMSLMAYVLFAGIRGSGNPRPPTH